jgi:methylmalonyl-CoA mutase C-terminal domain/subunit
VSGARVLVAKTSLDGHWRGVYIVARGLQEAGFEVIMLGMASGEEIVAAAVEEDVALVGLNVGGRVEVVERTIDRLHEEAPDVPVIAGGTIAPWAARQLETKGVEVFPPGSSIAQIVEAARRLTSTTAL